MIVLFHLMNGLKSGTNFSALIQDPRIENLVFPFRWGKIGYKDFLVRINLLIEDILNRTTLYRDFSAGNIPDKIENIRKYFLFFESE